MAFVPVSGTDGRVVSQGSAVYGIKSWKLSKKTAIIVIPHFESDVDTTQYDTVWPDNLAGLSGATVTFEGQANTDPTDATDSGTPEISNGAVITVDLYESKDSSFGYEGLIVRISDFDPGTNVDNQPASFTASGTIRGICPRSATIA